MKNIAKSEAELHAKWVATQNIDRFQQLNGGAFGQQKALCQFQDADQDRAGQDADRQVIGMQGAKM